MKISKRGATVIPGATFIPGATSIPESRVERKDSQEESFSRASRENIFNILKIIKRKDSQEGSQEDSQECWL